MERAGSAGGKATLKKYGVQHFKEIGKRGIQAVADKYFTGSIPDAMQWLRSRGAEKQIAALVDLKLAAQIAEGKQVVCEELPVLCSPDNDPSYWRDLVRKRKEDEIDLPF